MEKTKLKLWKKILIGAVATVLVISLGLGITVFAVWHNEISTISSMNMIRERNDEHLDGSVYMMNVKGDFYLDDFVEQGGVKSRSAQIELRRFSSLE